MINGNVKINGLDTDNDMMVCLSNVPTIVSYETEDSGSNARLNITVSTNYAAYPQYMKAGLTITIGGETITSVTKLEDAKGRYFYLGANYMWVAQSIVNALRNCPILSANYNIHLGKTYNDIANLKVIVEARTNGSKWNFNEYSKTVENSLITMRDTKGSSSDSLKNATSAKCLLAIYAYDNVARYYKPDIEEVINGERYITTLEKTYYGGGVDFDISPVLQSVCKYGKITYFRFEFSVISSTAEEGYTLLKSQKDMFVNYGYRCNDSQPYIHYFNTPMMLQNYGNGIKYANAHKLYLRKPYIDFSWISNNPSDGFKVAYLDGNYSQLSSFNIQFNNGLAFDHRIMLDEDKMKNARYVSVELPSERGTVLYEVIQGLKLNDKCTRLYWRNEYGGISFFDFTGSHGEEISISNDVYSVGDFGYYRTNESEKLKMFRKEVVHNYSVTSHIIDESGTKQAESLAKSEKVWIEEGEIVKDVIVNDVKINKHNDYDNIFTVSVSYSMSRED